MTVVLGCIADDFTGATDLAGMLARFGMRAVQTIGVPTQPASEIKLMRSLLHLNREQFLLRMQFSSLLTL